MLCCFLNVMIMKPKKLDVIEKELDEKTRTAKAIDKAEKEEAGYKG